MSLSQLIEELVELKISGEPERSDWTPIHGAYQARQAYNERLDELKAEIDEAAQHPTSAPDSSVEVLAYGLDDMTVDRVRQRDGGDLWAVRSGSMCLSTQGEWDWEPMPSSRTDEWLGAHRFQNSDEAIRAAIAAKEQRK